ncbi:MAG: T9SS type A sorting domain-containing protein, partial [Flavisolibacter sp.]
TSSPNSDIALLRFGLNGAPDPSFSGDGWLTLDMAQRIDVGMDLSVQIDGKIIVLGTGSLFQCPCPAVGNYAYVLARYNSDGTVDTGFGVATTLPIYNVGPPNALFFPGMGKTVMGSFLRAFAMVLYGDSIYVAGGTTPVNKGEGTFVFINALHNDGSPLNFSSNLSASIPSAYALPQGVAANTVYRGYAPASTLTLTVQLPADSYSYAWSTGATTSSISVAPTSTTNYSVTATNAFGCTGTASTTVQVVDVRCGNGNDKVQVCQVVGVSGKKQSICIAPSAVAAHLKNGSYLGSCTAVAPFIVMKEEKIAPDTYNIKVLNNPTTNFFTLDIQSPNTMEKVTVSIYDASGSIKETRVLLPNNRVDLGLLYPKGVYFAEVVQGNNKHLLRLVKL